MKLEKNQQIEKIKVNTLDPRLGTNFPKIHQKAEEAVLKLLEMSNKEDISVIEMAKIVDTASKYLKNIFADPDFLARHISNLHPKARDLILVSLDPEKKKDIVKEEIDDKDIFG